MVIAGKTRPISGTKIDGRICDNIKQKRMIDPLGWNFYKKQSFNMFKYNHLKKMMRSYLARKKIVPSVDIKDVNETLDFRRKLAFTEHSGLPKRWTSAC
jgi:hypothetical protein